VLSADAKTAGGFVSRQAIERQSGLPLLRIEVAFGSIEKAHGGVVSAGATPPRGRISLWAATPGNSQLPLAALGLTRQSDVMVVMRLGTAWRAAQIVRDIETATRDWSRGR
jgi:hypothetical protein